MRAVAAQGLAFRARCGAVAVLLLAAPALAQDRHGWDSLGPYCNGCHNSVDWAGGLAFDALADPGIDANPALFEQVLRKLRGGLMPPPGSPQPSQDIVDAFVAATSASLDARPGTPRAGQAPPQRLSRSEFAVVVRDLLGVEIDASGLLPPEQEVAGFDNIAAALETSPAFVDQYLAAAVRVSRLVDLRQSRVFVCQPRSAAEEPACARRIAGHLAQRAYRRPVTAADIDRLMPFHEQGQRETGRFEAGIQQLVAAVLASPEFLFRSVQPAGAGGTQPLGDLALATRLSFFLWRSVPDEPLLAVAAAGRLQDPQVLESELRRMLADPRATALVEGFALRWLDLDELDVVAPDERLFPAFTPALRADFAQELRLFLQDVLLQDRSIMALLDGRDSFLNERLARHYGIAGVQGAGFRRVALRDERRFGLLGKGAMLLRTSYGDRSSPVLRGAWVLDKLRGAPPPPPPPGVDTALPTLPGERPSMQRERLAAHREQPQCNRCHGVIDPIGLALEGFDVTGRWRDTDPDIDARVAALRELRQELARRPGDFALVVAEKLLMHATGRQPAYHDMPQLRRIVREAARDGYRFSALVRGIVLSDAFRLQASPCS
ncbi:MAG: hypothetical protein RL026_1442 [Pseudomonadota bacterium]